MRAWFVYESIQGANTSWTAKGVTVSLDDINSYLDKNKVPVKTLDPKLLKPHLIKADRDKDRIQKASLDFPIIIALKDGKIAKILDGQHRVVKALTNNVDKIKARVLDLDTAPSEYQSMFESVNFERGLDPKTAMGIGIASQKEFPDMMAFMEWLRLMLPIILDTPPSELKEKIYWYATIKWEGSLPDKMYVDIYDWILQNGPYYVAGMTGRDLNASYGHDAFPKLDDTTWTKWLADELIRNGLLDPAWHAIPDARKNYGKLEESVNFERGLDPKTAMGIGDKEAQAINGLSKFAKKYKFVEVPFTEYDFEEGIINVAKWERPKKLWSDEPIQVQLYKDSGYLELLIYFTDINGQSGSDSVEDWMNDEIWRRHAEDY